MTAFVRKTSYILRNKHNFLRKMHVPNGHRTYVNKASNWLIFVKGPIRGFVYIRACEFQYELLNFTTKFGTKFATFTEKLYCMKSTVIPTGNTTKNRQNNATLASRDTRNARNDSTGQSAACE